MNEQLKPCPFCGSTDITVEDILGEDEEYYMIQCESCGAAVCFGYTSETKEGAIKAWNKRATETVVNQNEKENCIINNTGTLTLNL